MFPVKIHSFAFASLSILFETVYQLKMSNIKSPRKSGAYNHNLLSFRAKVKGVLEIPL